MAIERPARALATLLLTVLAPLAAAETLEISRDIQWSDEPFADDRGLLDVYAPASADGAPVVVFVHGGALLFGDKSLVAHVGVRLARAGIVTVAINHRLSPAVRHPAHVEDAAKAVRWVVDEIGAFGGDPDRIVLAGHSAGAYLAALLGTDRRWLQAEGIDRERMRGIAALSGFFHVPRVAPERPESIWGTSEVTWRDASPARHLDGGVPPVLLVWADGDTEAREDESVDFATKLRLAEMNDITTLEAADRDHRSLFFLLGSRGDATTEALLDFVGRVTLPLD